MVSGALCIDDCDRGAEVWTVSFQLSASVVIMSGRRELMGTWDQRSSGDRRRDQALNTRSTHLENINH